MALTPEQREKKADELARRYRERILENWPKGDADITQIEECVEVVEREAARELTQAIIDEQSGKRAGNHVACPFCGRKAIYRKQAETTLVAAFGRVRAERAHFYCFGCREGHCPQDYAWSIGHGRTTPAVQSIVGYMASKDAYADVPATMHRVRPAIHLGTKTIELIAQSLGHEISKAPPRLNERAARALVVAVDGTMLLTREGGKEVRCGVIYEPDWDSGRTPEVERGLRKEYFGTLESRDTLIKTVCEQVERRRPTPQTKVAALGDGAPWIWRGYAKHLPNRVEILDFYHVCEHLSVVADAWYGKGTDRAKYWVAEMKGALKGGGPNPLLRSIRAWQPKTAAAKRVKERELGYFQKNRNRMQYHVYLKQGWAIGSGSVEGACKHLVGKRFKQAGMRWKTPTAEPILQLRAAIVSHPDLDLRPYASRHMLAQSAPS